MKKLLILLIVALCAIGWRSDDFMELAGLRDQSPSTAPSLNTSLNAMLKDPRNGKRPMTAEQFAELSKSDPAAYRKFIDSHRIEDERSEMDKLMNFLARGKYE